MFQIFKVLKSELFYSVLFCHQLYQHQQSRLGRTCNYLLSIAFETKTFNLASYRTAIHTVPTGFSTLPPPGPAIPEVAIAQSEDNNLCTPDTICKTVSLLTAPKPDNISDDTFKTRVFTSLE